MRRSAEAMAAVMRDAGVEHVEILEVPGVHPYVYGDWLEQAGRAHAPALRAPRSCSPRAGPSTGLAALRARRARGPAFGRGTADDKGGILAHVAAVAAYLRSGGSLPCNVRS